ncbi:hypothetical protein [Kitasatospora sp. NPDC097691]|uniref:hypothetical protein n=1 Tax=Kitasatospora sp. NPDC097691 TaxID=3157231 RepID=UPI00331F9322
MLRSSAHYSAGLDLADLLIRQGRPAEALACVPTVAEQRAGAERREREAAQPPKRDDPRAGAGDFAQEPPF